MRLFLPRTFSTHTLAPILILVMEGESKKMSSLLLALHSEYDNSVSPLTSPDDVVHSLTTVSATPSIKKRSVSFELERSTIHNYDLDDIIQTYHLSKKTTDTPPSNNSETSSSSSWTHYVFSFTCLLDLDNANAIAAQQAQQRSQYVSMFAPAAAISSLRNSLTSTDLKPELDITTDNRLTCKIKLPFQKCEFEDVLEVEYVLEDTGYTQKAMAVLVPDVHLQLKSTTKSKRYESVYSDDEDENIRVREYRFSIDLSADSVVFLKIEKEILSKESAQLRLPFQWEGCISFSVLKFKQKFNLLMSVRKTVDDCENIIVVAAGMENHPRPSLSNSSNGTSIRSSSSSSTSTHGILKTSSQNSSIVSNSAQKLNNATELPTSSSKILDMKMASLQVSADPSLPATTNVLSSQSYPTATISTAKAISPAPQSSSAASTSMSSTSSNSSSSSKYSSKKTYGKYKSSNDDDDDIGYTPMFSMYGSYK